MAGYIINEADFPEVRIETEEDFSRQEISNSKISALEEMIERSELSPVKGLVRAATYGFVEINRAQKLIGPNLIILLAGKNEPHGIAFEGDREKIETLLNGYGINKLEALRGTDVNCYIDPETQKIFAIKC